MGTQEGVPLCLRLLCVQSRLPFEPLTLLEQEQEVLPCVVVEPAVSQGGRRVARTRRLRCFGLASQ